MAARMVAPMAVTWAASMEWKPAATTAVQTVVTLAIESVGKKGLMSVGALVA